jgi:hypothetical protein
VFSNVPKGEKSACLKSSHLPGRSVAPPFLLRGLEKWLFKICLTDEA